MDLFEELKKDEYPTDSDLLAKIAEFLKLKGISKEDKQMLTKLAKIIEDVMNRNNSDLDNIEKDEARKFIKILKKVENLPIYYPDELIPGLVKIADFPKPIKLRGSKGAH